MENDNFLRAMKSAGFGGIALWHNEGQGYLAAPLDLLGLDRMGNRTNWNYSETVEQAIQTCVENAKAYPETFAPDDLDFIPQNTDGEGVSATGERYAVENASDTTEAILARAYALLQKPLSPEEAEKLERDGLRADAALSRITAVGWSGASVKVHGGLFTAYAVGDGGTVTTVSGGDEATIPEALEGLAVIVEEDLKNQPGEYREMVGPGRFADTDTVPEMTAEEYAETERLRGNAE